MEKKMSTNYTISKKESQVINLYKLFLTVFVVFAHSYNTDISIAANPELIGFETMQYVISQIWGRCPIPAFFLISGILLYRKEFQCKENMTKKVRSLLIPYVILITFWIVFYAIVQRISFLSSFFSQPENIVSNWNLLAWIDKYIGFTGFPLVYPLWFVRDLFVLNILAIFFKKLVDRFPKAVFLVLIATLIFNFKLNLFFMQEKNTVFFILGYYMVKYDFKLESFNRIKMRYIIPLCALSVFVDVLTQDMSLHYLFRTASNIMCFLLLLKISFLIIDGNKGDMLLKIGKYGFLVYLFHEMNMKILKKIMAVLLPANAYSYTFQYFSIPFIIIACCIILAILLEKYFPFVYKILTGARK